MAGSTPARPDGAKDEHPPAVREVGGRLVISGGTVLVTADPDETPHTSSIATKTDTPLLETPRSVSIADRRTIDDLQAINVTQVHDHTVGFTPQDDRGPGFNRGFLLGFYDLRRDGLRTYAWSMREPVGVERIQYLRGPAAVLYGDGSPGGLVNFVLKKPLPTPRYEATVGAGELGFRRFTIDATGPVTASRGARYRIVAAGEGLDNGIDNRETRVSVLPMLAFDFGKNTTLHLDGEFYDQRGRGYRHTVPGTAEAQRGDLADLPWDLNMASPDDHWRGWNVSSGFRLDTRLSARDGLHVAGRYTTITGDLDFQALAALAPDGHTALRYLYRERSEWHEYQSDAFATFSRSTGGLAHEVVAGLEVGVSTTDSRIGTSAAPSLDIFDPVYGPRPAEPTLAPTRNETQRVGLYLQDQMRVANVVTLVPALRWTQLRTEDRVAAERTPPGGPPVATDRSLSPSLGMVFLPRSWLSVYGSYAQGLEVSSPGQFLEGGQPLAPIESASLEGGLKAEVLDRRLSLTGGIFRIRQTGVVEADARGFVRQIGEGQSHGLEFEAVGKVAQGLAVRGGYAWTATRITQDASGFVGRALPNAPRHKVNVWTHYRFVGGPLRGAALGAGVVHVSERFTTRDNTIRLPPYTRFDATASFAIGGHAAASLAAENLTDVRYVTSGAGRVFFAGPGRRFAATLSSTF